MPLACAAVFGRRKKATGGRRDFLKDSIAARRAVEDEQPWFLAEDDGPELDIEAGRSAAMDDPGARPDG